MFGKTPDLNPLAPWNDEHEIRNRREAFYSTGLALQKQLLLAESELNRAQLVEDWQTLAVEAHMVTSRARTIGVAAAAATLVAGLAACRRKTTAPAAEKPSWGQTILKVAGLFSTFWSEFRARRQT